MQLVAWVKKGIPPKPEPTFFLAAQVLLILFFLLVPLQIRTLLFDGSTYSSGNFNMYVSFFLYGADVVLLGACLALGVSFWKGEARATALWREGRGFGDSMVTGGLLVFVGLAVASILVSGDAMVSFWSVLRLVELLLLYFLLVSGVLSRRMIVVVLGVALLLQAFIAIAQYGLQSSIGLGFFGEPAIGATIPGVAKMDLSGTQVVRPYGTMPHPNVLGGLLAFTFLWLYHFGKKNLIAFIAVASVIALGLILTFSRSALLAFGGGLLIYFSISEEKIPVRFIVLTLVMLLFFAVLFELDGALWHRIFFTGESAAVTERFLYMDMSQQLSVLRPFGVGAGGFTLLMQDFAVAKLAPWGVQPVHNYFLLALNEIGIQGLIALVFLVVALMLGLYRGVKSVPKDMQKKKELFVYIATLFVWIMLGMFDHYFWTLYPAQVFLFTYFALASSSINMARFPSKKS